MRARSALAIALAQAVAVVTLVGFSVRGLLIGCATAALVVLCADEIAAAPALLPFWRSDFRPHWHHEVLPVLYGARDSSRALAGATILLALLCLLRGLWQVGVILLAAAAVAVRIDQADWSFSWTALNLSLSRIREVGWSVRIVEYLPLAGLGGAAIRRSRAAAPLATLFLVTLVWPLGRDRGLLRDAIVVVPGLPLYAVLVGCLVLLVPAQWRARAYALGWAGPRRRSAPSGTT
jgi:hypothetical protein